MKKILCLLLILLCILLAAGTAVLYYFKYISYPRDKDGMVYVEKDMEEPVREGRNPDSDYENGGESMQSDTNGSSGRMPMGMMMNPGEVPSGSPFERTLAEDIDPEAILLVDSYHAALSTGSGTSYNEITLNRGSDGNYYLNEYFSQGTGTPVIHKVYRLHAEQAEEILQEVQKITSKYDVLSWDTLPTTEMNGGCDVVKFRDRNDTLVRLSTDQMPDDGEGLFGETEELLSSYPAKAERVM